MSDIKNIGEVYGVEVGDDWIKLELISSELTFERIPVYNLRLNAQIKENASLITTIESQKEEIERVRQAARHWQGRYDDTASQIESQEITIETLRSDVANFKRLHFNRTGESVKRGLEIESLQKEKASLTAFAKQIIAAAWEGGQYDGGDIQDLGVKHGLLAREPYDPDKHGIDLGYDFAPGDPIYMYVPFLQERIAVTNDIIHKNRIVSNFKDEQCPECKAEFQTGSQGELNLPYCGACGKIVLDATQNYCCWCGCRYKQEGESHE